MKFLKKECPDCNGKGFISIAFSTVNNDDLKEIHQLRCFLCKGSGTRPTFLGNLLEDSRNIAGELLIKVGESIKSSND